MVSSPARGPGASTRSTVWSIGSRKAACASSRPGTITDRGACADATARLSSGCCAASELKPLTPERVLVYVSCVIQCGHGIRYDQRASQSRSRGHRSRDVGGAPHDHPFGPAGGGVAATRAARPGRRHVAVAMETGSVRRRGRLPTRSRHRLMRLPPERSAK